MDGLLVLNVKTKVTESFASKLRLTMKAWNKERRLRLRNNAPITPMNFPRVYNILILTLLDICKDLPDLHCMVNFEYDNFVLALPLPPAGISIKHCI